jgi:hypothetical protein
MNQHTEYFPHFCPACHASINAAEIAATLPDQILRAEIARRNGQRQTPHGGPGRPAESRCPGCEEMMTNAELRDHRLGCVRDRLDKLQKKHLNIHLYPKDPDPYLDFAVSALTDVEVTFTKFSSGQPLTIGIEKIANITERSDRKIADIQLRGRVVLDQNRGQWIFMSRAAALQLHSRWLGTEPE